MDRNVNRLGMTDKTCLVTGASGGLGKETALGLARMGATVLLVARDRERGEEVITDIRARAPGGRVELLLCDLSDQSQVRQLAAEVRARHVRLDVLVNNAACVEATRQVTEDGLEATLATNHLAPFLLTSLLLEPLKRASPSRIVTVASYLHRQVRAIPWDDLQSERRYASHTVYNLTKLMNVLFTYHLARRLAGTGVTANCLHPGWPLRTDLGREERGIPGLFDRVSKRFAASAERGAQTTIYLATSPAVTTVSGAYFSKGKPAESSKLSRDGATGERLWEISSKLCGL